MSESVFFLFNTIVSVRWKAGYLLVEVTGKTDPTAVTAAVIDAVHMAASTIREDSGVIWETDGDYPCLEDPMGALIENGDVLPHAPGVYSVQGPTLTLMAGFDAEFSAYARRIGAVTQSYPSTVRLSSLASSGYLAHFPHHALLVAATRRSPDVADNLSRLGDGDPDLLSALAPPEAVLAPTVCYRCFEGLKGSVTDGRLMQFTGRSRCHRNEGALGDGLDRLQDFLMREIVWIGTRQAVERAREDALTHTQLLLGRLGLRARAVIAADAFFLSSTVALRRFQLLRRAKYEVQLYVPHADDWLACMSFNVHDRALTTAFELSSPTGPLSSGCVGYGLERLCYALYAQWGVHPRQWPPALRSLPACVEGF